jgi:hypothetical protein
MTGATFSIAPRICGVSRRGGHLISAEDLLGIGLEAAEQPCIIGARHVTGKDRQIIFVKIVYKAPKVSP